MFASHIALASDYSSKIHSALFEAEWYGLCFTVSPLASRARFASWSDSLFQEMPEWPGSQWMLVAILCTRRVCGLQLICPANGYPSTGSWCAVSRIAACESPKTATVSTPCSWSLSLHLTVSPSTSPIAHCLESKTSIHPVPRQVWWALHALPWLHAASAPTQPSSEHDPSVQHILTAAPTFPSFSLAQCCAALMAMHLSYSIMVLTTGS